MAFFNSKNNFILIVLIICGLVFFKIFNGHNKEKKNNEAYYIENISTDVPTFDPHKITDNVSWRVAMDIYEGLVGYNQKGELVLLGAENYNISEDGKIYTFFLRKNAKWSTGEPVTAADYVYSFQKALTPETLGDYFEQLLPIKNAESIKNGLLSSASLGVEAVDDFTLKIELEYPSIEFLHYLTLWIAAPLCRQVVSKNENSWCANPRLIPTNGAYKIKEYISNGHVLLEKNDFYWNVKNVKINNVKFLMIGDRNADINKFTTGGEHVTYCNLPGENKEFFKNKYKNEYISYDVLAQGKLSVNTSLDKFKDIKVRKALFMTIDRETLVNKVLKQGFVSYLPILECMNSGYFKSLLTENEEFNWINWTFEDRVALARKLIMEAGYDKKLPLTFTLAYPNSKDKKIFEFFQTTWNTAFDGLVKCNLLSEEWKVFLINLNIGKYEVFHSDWMADFNLASCFSMLYTTGNGCNYSFCSDSKVDKLYKDSLLSKNSADYLKMQKELARIIMNSYVSIPYCGQKFSRLVSNKIGGFDFVNNNLDRFSSRDLFFK